MVLGTMYIFVKDMEKSVNFIKNYYRKNRYMPTMTGGCNLIIKLHYIIRLTMLR